MMELRIRNVSNRVAGWAGIENDKEPEGYGLCGPDADFTGYNFWLNKLNAFGNFQDAEMVKAFLVSGEYRGRFPR
jgi:hypothetical protein